MEAQLNPLTHTGEGPSPLKNTGYDLYALEDSGN